MNDLSHLLRLLDLLTPRAAGTLRILVAAELSLLPEGETLTPGELVKRFSVPAAQMSRALKELQTGNGHTAYISVFSDTQDRRRLLLSMTSTGLKWLQREQAKRLVELERRIMQLPEETRERLMVAVN